jgi:hypothetical protein
MILSNQSLSFWKIIIRFSFLGCLTIGVTYVSIFLILNILQFAIEVLS